MKLWNMLRERRAARRKGARTSSRRGPRADW